MRGSTGRAAFRPGRPRQGRKTRPGGGLRRAPAA